VVVAVDPRWLLASLRHHHRELFTETTASGLPEADDGLASPLDYLDKIFQIPFAVAPLSDAGASTYLTALLKPDRDTPTSPISHSNELDGPASMPSDDLRTSATANSDPIAADPSTTATHEATGPAVDSEPQPQANRSTTAPDSSPHPSLAPKPTIPRRDYDGHQHHIADTLTGQHVVPDLRPEGLRLGPVETEFMAHLGPLLPTPRAAKKLVNLYRLVRIGTRDQDVAAFIADDTYQVVQVLLAILVGAPTISRTIFSAILHATADDLVGLLRDEHPAGVSDGEWVTASGGRRRIVDTLEKIRIESRMPVTTLADYQQWCSRLARYSFHTRTLTDSGHP
jgi:hypothetical protein